MSQQRRPRHQRARILAIALLILGLAHAPLPRADFHNVRHQDAPGQVCEHHDHLLRWHPDAGQAEDVAILHWHWFMPLADPAGSDHPANGPALHAHLMDGWEATSPDSGPVIVPDTASRPIAPGPALPTLALDGLIPPRPADRAGPRAGPRPVHAFGATFTPRACLAAWLQRWSC